MRRWRDMGNTARSMPWAALVLLGVLGCEPIPVSGNPLQPVQVQKRASSEPPVVQRQVAPEADDGFDFDREDRGEGGDAELSEDPVELQARLLGVDPALVRSEQPAPRPVEAPAPTPAPAPEPARVEIPTWNPDEVLPQAGFGVRALATLTDVQPPRAVIGLADGSEKVVQAGTILQDEGLIVMAIGRDVVQVARVVPQGYYARVDTQTLQALFPRGNGSAAQ